MPDDLYEEFDSLQQMHDAEHRKEVELEKERYGPVPERGHRADEVLEERDAA